MQYIIATLAACSLMLTRPGFVQPAPSRVPDVRMTCQAGQVAAKPGEKLVVICTLEIPTGFHVYWKSPGASGTPTKVQVRGEIDLDIGDTLYPRPRNFEEPSGLTHGYEGTVHFLVPVTLPDDCPEGALTLTVRAEWLVCRKACWRGEATRAFEVQVSDDASQSPVALLTEAMRCIPAPLAGRPGTSMSLADSAMQIKGALDGTELPWFIPVEIPGVNLDEAHISGDTREFLVRIPYRLEPGNSLGVKPRIEGLLVFGEERHDPSFAFRMHVPPLEPGTRDEEPANRRNAP